MPELPFPQFIKDIYLIFRKTLREYSMDQVFLHAAALGFYTLFSLAPMLIIAVAVAGFVLGDDTALAELRANIEETIGPESAKAVEAAIMQSRPRGSGLISTALGFAFLVIGATTVFHQLQRSLNTIWSVVAKPSRSGLLLFLKARLLSLALVVTIGFLLLVSLVLSTAVTAFVRYGERILTSLGNHFGDASLPIPLFMIKAANMGVSLLVFSLLFGLIFKILPDVHLRWRDVWKGAVFTAFLFMVGEFFISLYLTHFGPTTFGAAGAIIAVILWVYYSALIMLFGAEFIKVYVQFKGRPVLLKSSAARVHRKIVEE